MGIQYTTGFLDAIANYMSGVSGLNLTKGTNLFAENYIDEPDLIKDQIVLFDAGNQQVEGYFNVHLRWSVRLVTTRKTRLEAAEALRPILNTLIDKRTFLATSDENEKFKILRVELIGSPSITAKTETGRFAAQCTLEFRTIPE